MAKVGLEQGSQILSLRAISVTFASELGLAAFMFNRASLVDLYQILILPIQVHAVSFGPNQRVFVFSISKPKPYFKAFKYSPGQKHVCGKELNVMTCAVGLSVF